MRLVILSILILAIFGCDRAPEGETDPPFTFQDEIELSNLMLVEILDNPNTYQEVIEDSTEAYVYSFLDRIKDSVISSGQIQNPEKYEWEFFVLNDSFGSISHFT